MSKIAKIDAVRWIVQRCEGTAGGEAQEALGARTTLLAERIWEAFARHRLTTSKVALPSWEAIDEEQRADMISLAAEALGLVKTS